MQMGKIRTEGGEEDKKRNLKISQVMRRAEKKMYRNLGEWEGGILKNIGMWSDK